MTPRLTDRYVQALTYASDIHARQTRKGDAGIPYISHLLAASSLVIEVGGDEDEAIAALLHDAAEDQGGEERLADISDRFGHRVAGIVRECSDSVTQDPEQKAPWKDRKKAHLKHLQSASSSAVMVIAADKLHNARSLVLDLQHEGRQYLNNFNTSGANIMWYYREMYSALIAAAAPARLTSALGECVMALEDLMNTNGYQPLQTIQADWIRGQETGLLAEEVDTVLFTQWRNADEAEPGSVPLKSWTVEAVDAMKRSGAPMVAEVWTKGPHWQVTMTAPTSQQFIAAFRSDGTWITPDGRLASWSGVKEGGPQEIGVRIAQDYWRMQSTRHTPMQRYANALPSARITG